MSARTEVLLWAQRVLAKKGAPAHQLLEIKADAAIEDAQAAFHKVARVAHPDMHRTTLSAEELEQVTTAYSRITSAYQELRSQRMYSKVKPIEQNQPISKPVDFDAPVTASGAMTSKALVYYRKAEAALRRGDLHGALLQPTVRCSSSRWRSRRTRSPRCCETRCPRFRRKSVRSLRDLPQQWLDQLGTLGWLASHRIAL
jgi:hypothetical protein